MAVVMMCPCLWYHDAPKAMDWLAAAFGFAPGLVVPGPDGISIAHAELHFGSLVVMMGSLRPGDALGMVSPQQAGGITQSVYIVVDDADLAPLYEQALKAGARSIRPLAETDYGSREFTVGDLEGHLWHFGTYVPNPA